MKIARFNSLIVIYSMLLLSIPVTGSPIAEYIWQKRPLLLFAANQHDLQLAAMLATSQARTCDLDDRDMIIGVIVNAGPSLLANKPISNQAATSLREQYEIAPTQFAVVLIGKDGGEKYRLYEVPDIDEIFTVIDGMPMRQDEMEQNPVDCSTQ